MFCFLEFCLTGPQGPQEPETNQMSAYYYGLGEADMGLVKQV
jgi:hypothetical protein